MMIQSNGCCRQGIFYDIKDVKAKQQFIKMSQVSSCCTSKRMARKVLERKTTHGDVSNQCFLMNDCIDKGCLTVEHFPTADMIGDFPIKPL